MAEPAAADHRHRHAAGGHQRSQDQRNLVADSAGGMLVDLDAGNAARSATAPERIMASVRQEVSSAVIPRRKMAISNAVGLVIRPSPVSHAVDEGSDFIRGERMAVALAGDDGLGKNGVSHAGSVTAARRTARSGKSGLSPAQNEKPKSWDCRGRRIDD